MARQAVSRLELAQARSAKREEAGRMAALETRLRRLEFRLTMTRDL
jgi:hypothetical protein